MNGLKAENVSVEKNIDIPTTGEPQLVNKWLDDVMKHVGDQKVQDNDRWARKITDSQV